MEKPGAVTGQMYNRAIGGCDCRNDPLFNKLWIFYHLFHEQMPSVIKFPRLFTGI